MGTTLSTLNTLTRDTSIAVSPTLAMADLGGEAVLLDSSSGTYFGLNEVAARIVALASEPITLDEVIGQLLEEFEVEKGRLERDVTTFVLQLAERGLMTLDP